MKRMINGICYGMTWFLSLCLMLIFFMMAWDMLDNNQMDMPQLVYGFIGVAVFALLTATISSRNS